MFQVNDWRAVTFVVAALLWSSSALGDDSDTDVTVELTRLDCGRLRANDFDLFSDTRAYVGQAREITDSCYLIRHGESLMIWDTGLPVALLGAPLDDVQTFSATLDHTLAEQLAVLDLTPGDIDYVGISHYHFDHIGQLDLFTNATLVIGQGDWDAVSATQVAPGIDPAPFAAWIAGERPVQSSATDIDVFGDGTVVVLTTPGHTPGHTSLLVQLRQRRPVLLSGDAAHVAENFDEDRVPSFNVDRADTLASLDRLHRLAENLHATVIIQHEPRHIRRLPRFPRAAR